MFEALRSKLPPAETLSQQNGASLTCDHHGGATYTLLDAIAAKVPIHGDADLVQLVPWCRDADVCVRQIAMSAVVSRIGFDRNHLVIPHMHDPEHYLYHEILLALMAHLERGDVAYDPKIFAGLQLDVAQDDFPALIHGRWVEDIDPKTVNFASSVEVDASSVRVTQRHTSADPAWPDHTWTTKIAEVTLDEQRQYVVVGASDLESNAKGYRGDEIVPSQFVYSFWPVREDLVWFRDGPSAYWKKLRRA